MKLEEALSYGRRMKRVGWGTYLTRDQLEDRKLSTIDALAFDWVTQERLYLVSESDLLGLYDVGLNDAKTRPAYPSLSKRNFDDYLSKLKVHNED